MKQKLNLKTSSSINMTRPLKLKKNTYRNKTITITSGPIARFFSHLNYVFARIDLRLLFVYEMCCCLHIYWIVGWVRLYFVGKNKNTFLLLKIYIHMINNTLMKVLRS